MPCVHINGNTQFPMYINKQTRLTQIQLNSDSNRAYTALILLISMLTTLTDSTQSVRSTTSFYMLCLIILNGCLQSQHSFVLFSYFVSSGHHLLLPDREIKDIAVNLKTMFQFRAAVYLARDPTHHHIELTGHRPTPHGLILYRVALS